MAAPAVKWEARETREGPRRAEAVGLDDYHLALMITWFTSFQIPTSLEPCRGLDFRLAGFLPEHCWPVTDRVVYARASKAASPRPRPRPYSTYARYTFRACSLPDPWPLKRAPGQMGPGNDNNHASIPLVVRISTAYLIPSHQGLKGALLSHGYQMLVPTPSLCCRKKKKLSQDKVACPTLRDGIQTLAILDVPANSISAQQCGASPGHIHAVALE